MKRALTIATLACSVLFVGAMNTSEARPPAWKQVRRQSRNIQRDYRQSVNRFDRHYRNDLNRYSRGYNNYNRRYHNNHYRGRGAGIYAPGFGFYYGW
ncbi:hypothetical protein [uncultured Gimesia sp.]|uniref:hypothetical protein n=1 Tax=uncultured Gimesia sp. TaxID=1678688 RepID=UPI0030DB423D